MAKVIAIHTISRSLDDGVTIQELPPGTVFESDGPELEDFRKAGAVTDAGDDEPLSDLSAFNKSDSALVEPATTLMPSKGPEEPVAEDDDDEDETKVP